MSAKNGQIVEGAVGVVSRGRLDTVSNISRLLKSVGETFESSDSDRETSHIMGLAHSPLNGRQAIFALLGYDDIRSLEGKLLTIVDASFSDQQQRKAVKDLVRNSLWWDWVKHLDTDDQHVGKPDLDR